ncbi:MAG: hypothetical protein A2V66_07775 [Ignavibacteria bacterium RBG_13_36_8]|nr:MAG: hypothetical protein A2V66_07775 [Ignavibacteria bacterium RBG_13_36_8]
MKTGQLFWGMFFLALGALILFTKYDIIISNWDFVWDLWPLLLVFIGLMVVTKNTIVKPIISLLFGIFIAVVIFGTFYNLFGFIECNEDYDYSISKVYEENYNGSEFANLEVKSGAGTFYIQRPTDLLVHGTGKGNFADYNFYTYNRDNTAWVEFNLRNKHFSIFDGKIRNFLEIELNEKPVWDLKLDIGAARAKFDLSPFKIRDIDLNTGATSVYIKLGNLYDDVNVSVEMGAASLIFDIPKESGCKLTGKMFLMSKDLDGFIKRDKRYYETPNYEDAENKIDIDIQGGVSSVEINRY